MKSPPAHFFARWRNAQVDGAELRYVRIENRGSTRQIGLKRSAEERINLGYMFGLEAPLLEAEVEAASSTEQ